MRSTIVLLAALLVGVALAGCGGTSDLRGVSASITLADTSPDRGTSKSLDCGSRATIEITWEAVESGDIEVKVREGGGGVPIFRETIGEGPAGSMEDDLGGNAGSWQLIVDRSLEFESPFTVTLSC